MNGIFPSFRSWKGAATTNSQDSAVRGNKPDPIPLLPLDGTDVVGAGAVERGSDGVGDLLRGGPTDSCGVYGGDGSGDRPRTGGRDGSGETAELATPRRASRQCAGPRAASLRASVDNDLWLEVRQVVEAEEA